MSTIINPTVYPRDRKSAGHDWWGVLFDIGANYPDHPTFTDKRDTHNLIKSLISKFVCRECVENSFKFMREHPAELTNKETLMRWLCRLKNNSNEHEGKETIDCNEFIKNSINRDAGCKSCMVTPNKAPSVNIYATPIRKVEHHQHTVPAPVPPLNTDFESVSNWYKRYPSMRHAATVFESTSTSITPTGSSITSTGTAPDVTSLDTLEQRYPSLAGGFTDPTLEHKPEQLDGILKALDPLYQGPATFMGVTAQEMNLAYTPELTSNIVSLLTQVYMTNFGSLASTVLSSLGMIAVSIFAKNSLSHYDKLFIQNTAASMLFHSLNFLNPRIRDEIMPEGQKFIEGVTAMDVEKIKESLLYDSATNNKKNVNQEMLDILEGSANSKIDMNALDLRDTKGGGASGGALTHDEVSKLLSGSSSKSKAMYAGIGDSQDKYSFILENSLLG